MFVVIFTAELTANLEGYETMVAQLRAAVEQQAGFVKMESICDNQRELTLSYWESRDAIRSWGNNPLHRRAQALGKRQWYQSYVVEIAEIY